MALTEEMGKLADWELRSKALNGGPAEEKEAAGLELVRRIDDPKKLQEMRAESRLPESVKEEAGVKAAGIYGREGKHGCLMALRIGAEGRIAEAVDEQLGKMGIRIHRPRERVWTPPRGTLRPEPARA